MLITVIIPCYNEKKTISKIVDKIISLKNINLQVIVVDDFSNDGTREILKENISKKVDKIIYHEKNRGKGAAIKSSIDSIKGNIIIIQDADLEYDPLDYYNLIKPFNDQNTKVVYGSRVLGRKDLKKSSLIQKYRIFGNYLLTKFSNFINNQKLTDAHTCYKVFDKDVFLNRFPLILKTLFGSWGIIRSNPRSPINSNFTLSIFFVRDMELILTPDTTLDLFLMLINSLSNFTNVVLLLPPGKK